MNQIFHIRITWQNYLYLALLSIGACMLLWNQAALLATVFLLFLIITIERILHTIYTVTHSGTITLSYGRFSKKRILFISEIIKISKIEKIKIGNHALASYLLLELKNPGKEVAVVPVKEQEFIKILLKINPSIQLDDISIIA